MRPGEQQPGAEPGREWSNPYQQPGYQQPNPYQQPTAGGGWQQQGPGSTPGAQPGGYGYPGGPQGTPPAQPPAGTPGGWQQQGPPTLPPPPAPPSGGDDDKRKLRIAIGVIVAVAVVAGAAVTGVVLMGGDDDSTEAGENRDPDGESEEEPEGGEEETRERPADPDDPRRGVLQRPDPVVEPDWQVQTLENRHIAFDVPPDDWTINPESTTIGFEDNREGAEDGEIITAMFGVALYKDDYCPDADGSRSRGMAGTKGAQGATSTAEAAEVEARNWALGGYDQEQEGTYESTEPEEFENEHGISGHIVRATITDVPEDPEDVCGHSDGKVVTISYLDLNNDMATWVLLADSNVEDELPDETIEQIISSLRPYPVDAEQS
ncbi:hypothetical protein SAMN06297387_10872 [Streptomyces zhaozhouensis]|uniref:DUF8017 domain-containing protein n=1 Tax=Streptomyces zhaozhouensis TaxID=1300267 RepID=A0A286DW55_9ACTN|nr:hypothetical protein [Streptomyces zhaozhouensis]SOD62909.1 hypothetical protein SAMN06297387_10872 [Streptomyces zhaozhouensis]